MNKIIELLSQSSSPTKVADDVLRNITKLDTLLTDVKLSQSDYDHILKLKGVFDSLMSKTPEIRLDMKREETLQLRVKRVLALSEMPILLKRKILEARKYYQLEPWIETHVRYGEKLPKNKFSLRPRTRKCNCLICQITDTIRSYEAEKVRLTQILSNISTFSEYQQKSARINALQTKFSPDFQNNMPITLTSETFKDKGAKDKIYNFGPDNLYLSGRTAYQINKSIGLLSMKIEVTTNRLQKLKSITQL